MADIGVGDFVEFVGCSITRGTFHGYPRGAVRVVAKVFPEDGRCVDCGELAALRVTTDPPDNLSWCVCAWRPFHGPEQSKRLTCEEISA
jgi:hypothetical protein